MQFYEGFAEKARTEEFYNDLVNKVLFDTPVKFLQKYPEIQSYSDIINTQKCVQNLLDELVSTKPDSQQQLTEFLAGKADQIKNDLLKIFRKIFKLKFHQIKKRMIEKYIAMDGNILVNFNWKVNIIVSHNSNTKCMIPICSLELIIKIRDLPEQKRIIIQLQKQQLLDLLEKLKKIQSNFR